jgi:hypothetical protein
MIWASIACYGDSFTFLYVIDVHTSQETHVWAPTASYGDNFTFSYVGNVRTSQLVTGIAFLRTYRVPSCQARRGRHVLSPVIRDRSTNVDGKD